MPRLPLYQVDAFTDRPFAGNPAAVCLLEEALPAGLMQDIAAENNLSETAFVLRSGAEIELRWFTPTVEVDLCGHATDAVTFSTRSGPLEVRRGEAGLFTMSLPAQTSVTVDAKTAAAVAQMLGSEPLEVRRGSTGTLLAVLADSSAVERARPNFAAVAASGTSLCITAPGPGGRPDPVDFVSRYFAPAHGIPEDPVTGSAHCLLAPFWSERLGRVELRARQVSRRGGELSCAPAGPRVLVSGRACLVIAGTLRC